MVGSILRLSLKSKCKVGILVFWGCVTKYTDWWFKRQNFIFTALSPGLLRWIRSGLGFFWGLSAWLTDGHLRPVFLLYMVVSCSPFLIRTLVLLDTDSPRRPRFNLITSCKTSALIAVPFWATGLLRLELQQMDLGAHNLAHYSLIMVT